MTAGPIRPRKQAIKQHHSTLQQDESQAQPWYYSNEQDSMRQHVRKGNSRLRGRAQVNCLLSLVQPAVRMPSVVTPAVVLRQQPVLPLPHKI